MKKSQICFFSSLVLFTAFSIISSTALTAKTEVVDKTILDYYLQLPDKYFQCETEHILRQKDKLALIKKKDLKKGYIKSATIDGSKPIEIAIFTDDYMGIKVLALNVRCAGGCKCRKIEFFFVSEGKLLKKEGGLIFPKREDIEKASGVKSGYEFMIQEDGKNIKVVEEGSGKVLLNIEWSGGTFNIK